MIINQANLQGMYRTFKVIFNQAFAGAPSQCDLVAMRVPSTTREQSYPWLADFPGMREWIGDRAIKDISAFDYTIKNKSFESTVGVDRDDIDGYGPEVLTLNNPGTGIYKYKVYYFSDHGYAAPATTATVKVWVDGVLAGNWSQAITNYKTWNVCTITTAGSGPVSIAYVGGVTEPPAGDIQETKPLESVTEPPAGDIQQDNPLE